MTIRPTLAICLATGAITAAGLALPGDGASVASTDDRPVVVIEDFAFSPSGQLEPGATVEVDNRDLVGHTLTSNDGLFDTGVLEGGSAAQIVVPTDVGTFRYFCEIHPSMTGSFTVGEASIPDPTTAGTEAPDPTLTPTVPDPTVATEPTVGETAPEPTAAPTTTTAPARPATTVASPAPTAAPDPTIAAAAAPTPTTTLAPLPSTTRAAPVPETTLSYPVSPGATTG